MPCAAFAASLPPALPPPSLPAAEDPHASVLPPLYHYLAQVPDHRAARGRRHPLPAILAQVVCALLCGATHPQAICDWGRDHSPALLRQLGYTRTATPCGATLHYVLAALDWTALETQLRTWIRAVEAHLTASDPLSAEAALALDGKVLRGSLKMGAEVTAMVTALGHRLGLTHGAAEVQDGNEIAAVEALLAQLTLQGRVLTLDALHTQRRTAAQICAQGGEYLMTVKGNQPELQAAVQAVFAPERAWEQDRESAWEVEATRGRIEDRWLLAVSLPQDDPSPCGAWPEARQVWVVRRSVWHRKERRRTEELVYGITSLSRHEAGAADLLRLNRGHWQIESRSHWVRDVTMREDASLVRTGRIAQTLALCRTAALSRLRLDDVDNIAREQRRLAAQPEDCLRLLGLTVNN